MTFEQAPRIELLRAYLREARDARLARKTVGLVEEHLNCCWAVLMDDSGAYLDDSERLRAVRAALGDFRDVMVDINTAGARPGPGVDTEADTYERAAAPAAQPPSSVLREGRRSEESRLVASPPPSSIAQDIAWLHATIRWLILGEERATSALEDYVSRPTLARKAHDKLDGIAFALSHIYPERGE